MNYDFRTLQVMEIPWSSAPAGRILITGGPQCMPFELFCKVPVIKVKVRTTVLLFCFSSLKKSLSAEVRTGRPNGMRLEPRKGLMVGEMAVPDDTPTKQRMTGGGEVPDCARSSTI